MRCSNCGAPLPQPKPGEEYVRCEYCGYWNKIVDTQNYTLRLLEEVKQWISSLVPRQVVSSSTVDMVARHHLFQAYIVPRITPRLATAKAEFYRTISLGLVDVKGLLRRQEPGDPKRYFEESFKLSALSELAGSDEDLSLVNTAAGYFSAVAYINNALVNAAGENYSEAAKNLEEAAKVLDSIGEPRIAQRVKAVSGVYRALAEVKNRDPTASSNLIRGLDAVDPSDRLGVEVVKVVVDWSNTWLQHGRDPFEPYVKTVEFIKTYRELTGRPVDEDFVELLNEYSRVHYAKLGAGKVRYAQGAGDVLAPFYLSKVTVTAVTGGLLSKKGEMIDFNTLVPASTPLTHPPVIDVDFVSKAKGKGLKEKVKAFSASCVEPVVKGLRDDSFSSSLLVVPPLTPRSVAERYYYEYWKTWGPKFKATNIAVEVGDLVYVPGVLKEGYVEVCGGVIRLLIRDAFMLNKVVV
ncbi:hypothetical protein [Thermogladius sp.]|uniref:hypothetical protein n=1 Tax=Thermogladius sp. TaxID=2023064 RepID=UPI003D1405D1